MKTRIRLTINDARGIPSFKQLDNNFHIELNRHSFGSIVSPNILNDEPFKYIGKSKKFISFRPIGMRWNNRKNKQNIIINGVNESKPLVKKNKIVFGNIFGRGTELQIEANSQDWRKIISINKTRIGTIPSTAEFLEISFEIKTNFPITWNKETDMEITGLNIYLDKKNRILPPLIWDSENSGQEIKSYLWKKRGKLYFVKQIPVEFIKRAILPIYTDAEIEVISDKVEFTDTSNYDGGIDISADMAPLAICKLDNNTGCVVYSSHTHKYGYLRSFKCSVNGTITMHNNTWRFDNGLGIWHSGKIQTLPLSGNRVLIPFSQNTSDPPPYIVIGTHDTNKNNYTWNFSIPSSPTWTDKMSPRGISATMIDGNRFAVGYRDTRNHSVVGLGSVDSGTNITYGEYNSVADNPLYGRDSSVVLLDTDKILFQYWNSSRQCVMRVLSVSGTTFIDGTTTTYTTSWLVNNSHQSNMVPMGTDKALFINRNAYADPARIYVCTVSGLVPTWEESAESEGVIVFSGITNTDNIYITKINDTYFAASCVNEYTHKVIVAVGEFDDTTNTVTMYDPVEAYTMEENTSESSKCTILNILSKPYIHTRPTLVVATSETTTGRIAPAHGYLIGCYINIIDDYRQHIFGES